MRKINTNKFKSIILLTISMLFLAACKQNSQQDNRVVIWTNCSEFAQYIELFNSIHKDSRAILVYKDNPALSLPPAKDELPPDIVVGSWLRTESTQKNFKSLDYLFDTKNVTSEIFYQQLLEAGKKGHTQYLLPVSFNLPAIIFSNENSTYVTDSYTLSLEQIRKIGAEYNQKNKKEVFTRIGFTPLSNDDFLYLTTKINGVNFREEKNKITWNPQTLQDTINLLKKWVVTENESAQTEQDFAFKYLFMPNYRQVTSGRTLFSYTTSDDLFKAMKNQDLGIDYRWIIENKTLPIEDSFVMMGIHKKANNQIGATEFIKWFFQSESQRKILERKELMNLETEQFGIAGGFSAVRDVTEHILPVFYTQLLTNLPPAQMLTAPQKLPARWESYKTGVVEPYLKEAITNTSGSTPDIIEFEKEWQKKVFD